MPDEPRGKAPGGISGAPVQSIDPLAWHKAAIAAVVVNDQLRGTGYLVAPDRVATCRHVVQGAPPNGAVLLYFPEGVFEGVVEARHESLDAALIKLTRRPLARPLPVSDASPAPDAAFRAFGFPAIGTDPAAAEPVMRSVTGEVRDAHGADTLGRPALQLYSDDMAAGKGALPQGFSGSAVVVNGIVAGHLNTIVLGPDADPRALETLRAELGAVDACPAAAVLQLLETPNAPYSARHRMSVPVWAVRPEERQQALHELTRPCGFVTLCAPPLHGKRLFMENLLRSVRGSLTATNKTFREHRIDFISHVVPSKSQDDASVHLAATLRSMAVDLVDRAGRDVEAAERQMSGRGMAEANFQRVLEKVLLDPACEVEILAMDHFDFAVRTGYQNSLYSMFRRMAVTRTGALTKLRMIATTHVSPSELIQSLTAGSHWNIGKTVFLGKLEAEQIEQLAARQGAGWDRAFIEGVVLPRLGGHPGFVQRLLELGPEAANALGDDKVLFRLFDDNLRDLAKRLEAPPAFEGEPVLKDVVIRILTTGEEPDELSKERLCALGILADDVVDVNFQYPLYERFLRRKWLRK